VKKTLIVAAIVALFAFWVGRISKHAPVSHDSSPTATTGKEGTPKPQLYTCGMHPNVIQDHPGDCPICGMKLTPMNNDEEDEEKAHHPEGERVVLYWRAPMDPAYISQEPGKSPMGMDLVPVYEDEVSSGEIKIDPVVMQNMGVTTAPVRRVDFARTIKTYGTMTWDETSLAHINTKVAGWVEKLYVNETGQRVRRGQPLMAIFSPELVTAQEEYLLAWRSVQRAHDSSVPAVRENAHRLLRASRSRLEYWDIRKNQIQELEKTGKVRRTLTLYAPFTGVVKHKMVVQGHHAKVGEDLMTVAALDHLWVQGSLYEEDIPLVKMGMEAQLHMSAFPGEKFMAKVDYIYPMVEGKRRTAEVRFLVPNPEERFFSGMYATVRLHVPIQKDALAVPMDAVIRPSSDQSLVFVERAPGRFSGRKVVLGHEGDGGLVHVLAGLKEGEKVVTSAQFLLDSESQLQAVVRKMLERKTKERATPSSPSASSNTDENASSATAGNQPE